MKHICLTLFLCKYKVNEPNLNIKIGLSSCQASFRDFLSILPGGISRAHKVGEDRKREPL